MNIKHDNCNDCGILYMASCLVNVSHTTKETKLLYWLIFRFNISTHGPITRSKRARSSLTQRSEPRAFTVAALGLFNNNAISPAM